MNYPLITLYVPGTRPELIDKAVRAAADAIIIDLEDTVPVNLKDQVRDNIHEILSSTDQKFLIRNI